MKYTQNVVRSLVAGALALAMVSTLYAQTATEGVVKVVRIKGFARFTVGNNVWQPLSVGDVLKPGCIVQTGRDKDSYVDLALGDSDAAVPRPAIYKPSIPSIYTSYRAPSAEQNVVRIWENSALGIDKLSSVQTGADAVTDTQLDLRAGRITGSVKKLSAASKYEIKLPNGVAGIRGTIYDLYANGLVRVRAGSLVLAWIGSQSGDVITQEVRGGFQYDPQTRLLTPIPQSEDTAFDVTIRAMRYVADTPTATLSRDRTIYVYMSPSGPPAGVPPATRPPVNPPPVTPPLPH